MADYSDLIQAAAQQYNVDPKLIGALIQTESSGNPNAVGPTTKYGTATGLTQMLPQTAKALGVTDTSDPKQAIFGAAKLLNENLTRYGNAEQAILAYHGGTDQANWGPKTQDYLQKVTANYQKQQAPAAAQTMPGIPVAAPASAGGDDPFSAAFGGGKGNAAVQSQGNDAFSAAFAPSAAKQAAPAAQPQAPAQASGPAPGSAADIGKQLGLTARMIGHGVGDAVGMIGNPLNLAINTVTGSNFQNPGAVINNLVDKVTPEPTGAVQQGVQAIGSAIANPLNALGGGYMAAAKGVGQTMARGALVGGVNGAMQQPSDGSAPTAGSMLQQAGAGALGGALLAPMIGGAGKLIGAASDAVGSGVNRLRAALSPTEAAPSANALTTAAGDAAQVAKPRIKLNTDGSTSPVAPVAAPAPAAQVPQFTAPASPTPKTSLPAPDQQARIDIMKQIGLETQRPSAITGDKFTAGTDFQQSKLNTPAAQVIRDQLAQEQNAIKTYADNLVQKTGAGAASPEQAGQVIRAPLQSLSDHYDTQIGQLYQAADQVAGGAPVVQPANLTKLLANPDFKETLLAQNQQGLLGSVDRQLQRFQGLITDSADTAAPNTVGRAESFRQWLNKTWTPENSAAIGQIKQALDEDVAKVGGADVYKAARALHAERKNTLDNPNGISALLSESGPGGINKKISDEAVPQKLLNMPTQQFKHIVDTINGLPQELQPQGQQALAEVKGALAQQIYKAGDSGGTQNGPSVWNAAGVTKALNANRSKLGILFTPEELQNFQTLNSAGHILQAPSAYPGAAVQTHNLLQRGMILAPAAAGAAIGHVVGGLPGATAGSMAGNALSRKVAGAADMAAANKLQQILQAPQVQAPNVIPISRANDLLRLTAPATAAGSKAATN
jgi:hypothetical protein